MQRYLQAILCFGYQRTQAYQVSTGTPGLSKKYAVHRKESGSQGGCCMKKPVLIAGISTALLLSILLAGCLGQGSHRTNEQSQSLARTSTPTSFCQQDQQALAKGTKSSLSCTDKVSIPSKGTGKAFTPKSTPTPSSKPRTPTPTPTPKASGPGGETDTATQLAQNLFALINSDRAAHGLPAYRWNATLAKGARQHSSKMAQPQCGLSHQCPGEPDPCQRVTNEGINWMACGENAGYTSPNPTAWTAIKHNIEQGMLNEQPPDDGHRKNLLSSLFHQIGVGIYIDAEGIIWVTEDFTN